MSSQFARLRGALDRVGTTTPGTIVGVFAEDLTSIMNHYVHVVREAAELKAARAQPAPITSESGNQAAQGASAITSESAQAVPLLSDEEIQAAWVEHGLDDCAVEDFARAIEQAVRAKLGAGVGWQPIETAPKDGTNVLCWSAEFGARESRNITYAPGSPGHAEGKTDRWWEWLEPKKGWAFNWSPTHWMQLPPPPGIVGKEGGNV